MQDRAQLKLIEMIALFVAKTFLEICRPSLCFEKRIEKLRVLRERTPTAGYHDYHLGIRLLLKRFPSKHGTRLNMPILKLKCNEDIFQFSKIIYDTCAYTGTCTYFMRKSLPSIPHPSPQELAQIYKNREK